MDLLLDVYHQQKETLPEKMSKVKNDKTNIDCWFVMKNECLGSNKIKVNKGQESWVESPNSANSQYLQYTPAATNIGVY